MAWVRGAVGSPFLLPPGSLAAQSLVTLGAHTGDAQEGGLLPPGQTDRAQRMGEEAVGSHRPWFLNSPQVRGSESTGCPPCGDKGQRDSAWEGELEGISC